MKRILIATVAGLMLTAPLVTPAAFAQPDRHNHNDRDRGRDNDRHHEWRDNDRHARWDANRHNGYWSGGRWYYGPPPASAYRSAGFALGYHPWARGERLGYYNSRYAEVDYRQYRLRPPPRGYHYVRADNGDIILAALATGLIASIIVNHG